MICFGVAAEVRDRRADVERRELDEQRERVGEREEEVRQVVLAGAEQPALARPSRATLR